MRMVLAHHFSDDTGALARGPSGSQPHLLQGVKNAAMHRLQSVADIGQRAPDNDRQRIVEVRLAHLFFDIDGLNVERARTLSVAARRRCQWKLGILIVGHFSGLGYWVSGLRKSPRNTGSC
jgi:hypothetical protein